jgi:hypothetical protein
MASVLLKNTDSVFESRAVWILVELMEHANTEGLIKPSLLEHLKEIK